MHDFTLAAMGAPGLQNVEAPCPNLTLSCWGLGFASVCFRPATGLESKAVALSVRV